MKSNVLENLLDKPIPIPVSGDIKGLGPKEVMIKPRELIKAAAELLTFIADQTEKKN